MKLLIIAILVFILFLIIRPYVQKYDSVLLYTGGLGSGKSLVSSGMATRLLRKNRAKVRWHNFKQRFKRRSQRNYKPLPLLYSSIPIRISKKEWSTILDPETLLLGKGVVEKSVIFIDEVSLYIDQMTTKYVNSDNLEEFITLARHYTKGGYVVLNSQSSNKCNFHIRYCVNNIINLFDFNKFLFLYWVKVRNISNAEDITTIEEGNKEDNYSVLFGLLPIFTKRYDTYCYSERYNSVPMQSPLSRKSYKVNKLFRKPNAKITAMTSDVDDSDSQQMAQNLNEFDKKIEQYIIEDGVMKKY